MTDKSGNGHDQLFEHFSAEYAQATEALKTIEQKGRMIVDLGSGDQLGQLLDQFVGMAHRAMQQAQDQGGEQYAEWFRELIERAEKLRGDLMGGS